MTGSWHEVWETTDWDRLGVDTGKPSVARVYDAVLGGKDNFAVDRAIAAKRLELIPDGGQGARLSRAFLARGVRQLARLGVSQFLDIGSGLPTVQNTHQVAQQVEPEAQVVYVDHDPMVLTHARALLTDDRHTRAVLGDLRQPEAILDDPGIKDFLDWSRPIGLLLLGIVHHLADGACVPWLIGCRPGAICCSAISVMPARRPAPWSGSFRSCSAAAGCAARRRFAPSSTARNSSSRAWSR